MTLNIFGSNEISMKSKMSKCFIGYLPAEMETSGYTVIASSGNDTVLNIFREDKNIWISETGVDAWIRIRGPHTVKLWSLALHGVHANSNIVFNIVIGGSNDSREFKTIASFNSILNNEYVLLKMDNYSIPAYKIFSINFKTDSPTNIGLKKLQLYVFNE